MHPLWNIVPAFVCSAAAYIVAELLFEQVAHGWRWHHALPLSVIALAVAGTVIAALPVALWARSFAP
jgi:ABC-type uncharacterized transport system permease subunit